MKKIIENLQALIDSVNFAETEHSANYVITEPDKKLLNEALDEALRIHNVVGQSEQLPILDRCGCEEPNEEPIKVCMNCNGYVE